MDMSQISIHQWWESLPWGWNQLFVCVCWTEYLHCAFSMLNLIEDQPAIHSTLNQLLTW